MDAPSITCTFMLQIRPTSCHATVHEFCTHHANGDISEACPHVSARSFKAQKLASLTEDPSTKHHITSAIILQNSILRAMRNRTSVVRQPRRHLHMLGCSARAMPFTPSVCPTFAEVLWETKSALKNRLPIFLSSVTKLTERPLPRTWA